MKPDGIANGIQPGGVFELLSSRRTLGTPPRAGYRESGLKSRETLGCAFHLLDPGLSGNRRQPFVSGGLAAIEKGPPFRRVVLGRAPDESTGWRRTAHVSDHWELDDLPPARRLDRSRLRRVFLQREVRPETVVVRERTPNKSAQLQLVEHHYMVDAVSTMPM